MKQEQEVAVRAVRLAAQVCIAVQNRLVTSDSIAKKDKSPVTIADFASQAMVSHLLSSAFPHIPLVGEEDASTLRENTDLAAKMMAAIHDVLPQLDQQTALQAIDRGTHEGGPQGRHWTLDPIDGTKGFLRGDQYAIALALIEDGEVVLGVLGCPNLDFDAANKGAIFVASKGQGAQVLPLDEAVAPPQDISVAKVEDISMARFCESVEAAHSSHSDAAKIAQILGITAPPYRIDSQCKYAAVSRGDAAIYLRLPTRPGYVERIWDHAAGVCVIQEAGGRVSDIYGNKLDFSIGRGLDKNKGVIVTNGQFHQQVLAAVQQVLGI